MEGANYQSMIFLIRPGLERLVNIEGDGGECALDAGKVAVEGIGNCCMSETHLTR